MTKRKAWYHEEGQKTPVVSTDVDPSLNLKGCKNLFIFAIPY